MAKANQRPAGGTATGPESRPTSGKVGRPKRSVTDELDKSLLDRALTALRESNYNEIALGRLAERIGVSKPTLYRRFRSKDGLVAAMVEAEFSRMMVPPQPDADGPETALQELRRYARSLFDVFISPATANFVRFQNQEGVDSPQLAGLRRKIHLTMLDNLASMIVRLQQAGNQQQRQEPYMLAALLVAQLQSPATLYGLGFGPEEVLRGHTPDDFFAWRFDAFLTAMHAGVPRA